MTALKQTHAPASTSPLDALSLNLASDMQAVNAVILARMASDIPLIPQLAGYLIAAGGKRMRPLLTLAAARACGPVTTSAHGLAAAVEFIHTATLLHDDVVDESAERRGQASANTVFGNQSSVLVGDFLFARAFELMVECGDIKILGTLAAAARIIAEGEILQLSLIGQLDLSLAQYRAIIEAKTAALFAAATESGARAAKAPVPTIEAFKHYGHHLGMAFQMIDDVMDYNAPSSAMGKQAGDDFAEGKITLPVLLALEAARASHDSPALKFWARCLHDKDQTPDDLAQACAYLDSTGALTQSRMLARHEAECARAALANVPTNPIQALMADLLDFVVNRAY